jgi:predicted histidine transporter YuiF (NhaC family)
MPSVSRSVPLYHRPREDGQKKKKRAKRRKPNKQEAPKKKQKTFARAADAAAMSVHLELLRCWMVLAAHLHRLPASC